MTSRSPTVARRCILHGKVTPTKLPRHFGREAFGENPVRYHSSRPQYPEWVYGALSSECGLGRNSSVFEIGAGTGTATRRLLELGADPLVAIEPDQRLANFLRAHHPDNALRGVTASFEDASLDKEAFDLGVSATAFHWLDEDSALLKVASLLRPAGWWAAVWNVFSDDSRPDPFHEATKKLLGPRTSPSTGEAATPSDWIRWLVWLPWSARGYLMTPRSGQASGLWLSMLSRP